MFEILKQPLTAQSNRWSIILIASISVFLVLALFQPFQLDRLTSPGKWLVISGFTVVTTLFTSIAVFILPWIFPRFYAPANWTWGKYIVQTCVIMLFISVGNTLFARFFYVGSASALFPFFITYLSITLMVGFVPVTLTTLLVQNQALKQNLKEAKELNLRLQNKETVPVAETESNAITLSGSTKESVTLLPNRFIYAEASGNYVKVNYLTHENTPANILLRTTITQVESLLESVESIRRCHRAFLVNTSYIINVEGNSQGFSLSLKHTKDEVPVSRSFTKEIREIISTNN